MSQELFRRQYGQWTLIANDDVYAIENRDADGTRKFFSVVPGKYGNPLVDQEPDRKIALPPTLRFIDGHGVLAQPKEGWGVIGFVCHNDSRTLVHRSSLSNPQCPPHRWVDDVFEVEGVPWHPYVLFDKDKDRMVGGYVLFCRPQPARVVKILELADLIF